MGGGVIDSLERMATFIPREERLELFNDLYLEYRCNARETAKNLGINIRRIYFYLPNSKTGIRNYPNDKTTYLILRALYRKNPEKVLAFLKDVCSEFNKLYGQLT